MIAVVGAGKSGISVANHATRRGKRVLLFDEMDSRRLAERIEGLLLPEVELVQGLPTKGEADRIEYVVVSPGVPLARMPVEQFEGRGIEVMGEVEYAFRNLEGRIVGITGTNGKSTVTALTGMMIERAGLRVFTGGNLQDPLTLACGGAYDFFVVELSSFQLETIKRFRPHVGVLLNLGEDHLDRYESFEQYCLAKKRLFLNQGEDDVAIYNASDPLTYSLARGSRGRKYPFSAEKGTGKGSWITQDGIVLRTDAGEEHIDVSGSRLVGHHNRENAAAAALAAYLAGISPGPIQKAIEEFRGLPHRMEHAGSVNDVDYYNDSKGTNVHALCSALKGVKRKVVLIAGGKDKGLSFEPARELVREKVRKIILIGEAAQRIREDLGNSIPSRIARSMDEAVRDAHESASPGDMVLLSPGCSSFDMYENFEKRGDAFKEAVEVLGKK